MTILLAGKASHEKHVRAQAGITWFSSHRGHDSTPHHWFFLAWLKTMPKLMKI